MPKVSKIPKQFQLGPHVIKVHLVSLDEMRKINTTPIPDTEAAEDDGVPWGLFIRGENVIFVQKVRLGFNESQQLHTFWHEFYHALFSALNENDMHTNERLVDQCGLLHTQFLQSAKY